MEHILVPVADDLSTIARYCFRFWLTSDHVVDKHVREHVPIAGDKSVIVSVSSLTRPRRTSR